MLFFLFFFFTITNMQKLAHYNISRKMHLKIFPCVVRSYMFSPWSDKILASNLKSKMSRNQISKLINRLGWIRCRIKLASLYSKCVRLFKLNAIYLCIHRIAVVILLKSQKPFITSSLFTGHFMILILCRNEEILPVINSGDALLPQAIRENKTPGFVLVKNWFNSKKNKHQC